MDPNLTIAIPTYNRDRYLEELLPQIISQCAQEADGLIEVLVIDNASSDETPILVKNNYENKVTYLRNTTNIGGDRNFIECVKEAKGTYVWLFGDDEIYVPGSISRILSALEQRPALLIVESDFPERIEAGSYREFLHKVLPRDPIFQVHHTLITKNVFPRAAFDLKFAEDRLASNYAHMYGLMPHLARDGRVVLFSKAESAFRVRDERAPFADPPTNLENKLVQLARDYSDALGDRQLLHGTWLFYKARPLYNLVYSKRMRRLRARWVRGWRSKLPLSPSP